MLAPYDADAYYNRALIYSKAGDYSRAIADLSEYIQLTPRDGAGYAARAKAFIAQRDYQRAQADLREAEGLAPQDSRALNSLAWLRATSPEDSLRDGNTAVSEARRACELTKWKNKYFIDTLAAAYAEVGDFDQAISYEEKAIRGLSGELRKEDEAHLALYREHKPYREMPAGKAPSPTPAP
jgi:tetratricopeptide (TPR) repeat protein